MCPHQLWGNWQLDQLKAGQKEELEVINLVMLVLVYQSDGKKTSAGDVTGFTDLKMDYKDHKKVIRMFVMDLEDKDIFLGMTWLWKHNPEINWVKREVKMTKCPSSCGKSD